MSNPFAPNPVANLTDPNTPGELLRYGMKSRSQRRFVVVFFDGNGTPRVHARSDNYSTAKGKTHSSSFVAFVVDRVGGQA